MFYVDCGKDKIRGFKDGYFEFRRCILKQSQLLLPRSSFPVLSSFALGQWIVCSNGHLILHIAFH